MNISELERHVKSMRKMALKMSYECGGNAHIGGAFSMMEMIAVLYGYKMNTAVLSELDYSRRDKFILSKGHGVLALYTALAEFGIIEPERLSAFQQNGSPLAAHPVLNLSLGIESSNGSLGQGISLAAGMALAAKRKGYAYQVYTICGNGECNEGAVWEAAMSAVNFGLDNFTLLIDNNGMQSDGFSVEVLDVSQRYANMLKAVGFQVFNVDGHNMNELAAALDAQHSPGFPKAVVARTIKGKGVSFMENNNAWHHNRLTKSQYGLAMAELEEIYGDKEE